MLKVSPPLVCGAAADEAVPAAANRFVKSNPPDRVGAGFGRAL